MICKQQKVGSANHAIPIKIGRRRGRRRRDRGRRGIKVNRTHHRRGNIIRICGIGSTGQIHNTNTNGKFGTCHQTLYGRQRNSPEIIVGQSTRRNSTKRNGIRRCTQRKKSRSRSRAFDRQLIRIKGYHTTDNGTC